MRIRTAAVNHNDIRDQYKYNRGGANGFKKKMKKGEVLTTALVVVVVLALGALFGPKAKSLLHKNESKKVEQVQSERVEAQDKITVAEKAVVHEANKNVVATGLALDKGDIDLAKVTNDNAKSGLAQIDTISPGEVIALRKMVDDYRSENKALRDESVKTLVALQVATETSALKLKDAESKYTALSSKYDKAVDDLQVGYNREKELADKYRWLQGIAGCLVVLTLAGLGFGWYMRLARTGTISRINSYVGELRDKGYTNDDMAEIRDKLRGALNASDHSHLDKV